MNDGAAFASIGPMDLDARARAASSDGPGGGGTACAAEVPTLEEPPGTEGVVVCQMEERAKSVVILLSSSLSVGMLTPSAETSGARNACGAARVDALVNALMGSALVRSAFIFCGGKHRVVAGALELFDIAGSTVADTPVLIERPMGAGVRSAISSSSSPSSGSGE